MNRDWYITQRPAGDFAVQKVVAGRIVRWGVYRTREQAEWQLRVLVPTREMKLNLGGDGK